MRRAPHDERVLLVIDDHAARLCGERIPPLAVLRVDTERREGTAFRRTNGFTSLRELICFFPPPQVTPRMHLQ